MTNPQSNSHKAWPSDGIPLTRILGAMGYDVDGGTAPTLDCPDCGAVVAAFVDERRGGTVITWCNQCPWFGDPFSFFMDKNKISDPFAALAALRAAKVKIPKACERTNVVRAYQKHLESRRALAKFAGLMRRRDVAHVSGQPLTVLGFPLRPHFHPHWWCTTLGEARGLLGSSVVSGDGRGWSGARAVAASDDAPVVMIPFYSAFGCVTGFIVAGESEYATFRGYGCVGGVAIANYGNRWSPRQLADAHFWTEDPTTAVALASGSMRDNSLLLQVQLFTDDSADTRYTLRTGTRPTADGVICTATSRPDVIRLARKTGAKIYFGGPSISAAYESPVAYLGNAAANAADWVVVLERMIVGLSDFSARAVLDGVGWDHKVAEKVRAHWAPSAFERAAKLMTSTTWRDLEIDDRLVVCDTPSGIQNTVTGQLLYEVVPVLDRVYRGDDGRTRYAGRIRLRRQCYKFDSAAFHKHPVSVIDSALLRYGVDPPRPHPALVPHLAAIAGWLGGKL